MLIKYGEKMKKILFILFCAAILTPAQNQDPTKITGGIIGVPKPTDDSGYLVGMVRDGLYYAVSKSAFQDSVLGSIPTDMTITGSITMAGVLVTTGTYKVVATNSGKIHLIPDLAGDTSLDLPAEVAGLTFEFWYVGGAAEAHDHTINSEANANFFIGGVSFLDIDAGDAADEVHVGLYSDGNSNSKFVINNASAGTIIKMVSDGTSWYITGQVLSDTVPSFADQ